MSAPEPEPDPLQDLMRRWQPRLPPTPLAAEVGHAIERESHLPPQRDSSWWSLPIWRWLIPAALFLTLGLLLGVHFERARDHRDALARDAWLLTIDPIARVDQGATPGPAVGDHPWEQLDWLRREFNLDAAQFEALAQLQETYRPRFETIFRQLSQFENSYESLDRQRRAGQMIDFIALYDLLKERDRAREAAHETGQDYLVALRALLHPGQREILEALLTPVHAA